ncbi:DUF6366 family protein [Halomonas sp. THAF12]|uniref:DUF6366 family protein n=1 Tax=Halomonas sp. B23F22_10 TaxID=3459515 RepID=UPI00373EDE4B
MSSGHDTEKEYMKRKAREKENHYNILTNLGWKSVGVLFLLLIIAFVVYTLFFR